MTRDKSKNPEVGDVLGEGKEKRTVVEVLEYAVVYEDIQNKKHTIGKKSWRDFFRKRSLS